MDFYERNQIEASVYLHLGAFARRRRRRLQRREAALWLCSFAGLCFLVAEVVR